MNIYTKEGRKQFLSELIQIKQINVYIATSLTRIHLHRQNFVSLKTPAPYKKSKCD